MTNTTLLRQKTDEFGDKLYFIVKLLGITYWGFQNKINNIRAFKASKIKCIRKLPVSDKERNNIFLISMWNIILQNT